MSLLRSSNSPHVFAALGSITILTTLPLLFYFALMVATNDVGGPLNLILIPCSNLFIASLFTLVIFFPLSKLLDRLFQSEDPNAHPKVKSIMFSGILVVPILVMIVVGFALGIGSILAGQESESFLVWLFRFLLLGGIPFLLGGATYWFLLEVSRKILSNSEGRRE